VSPTPGERIAGQPYTDDLTPFEVGPIVLEGQSVRLEPLAQRHFDGLCEVGLDPRIWRWLPVLVDSRQAMQAWLEHALVEAESGGSLPFATIERGTGRVVGSTRYMNVDRVNRHVEIGWTWIAPPWQRTAINTEAKLVQLAHAFERLRCLRVEFKTDSLNAASRRAIAALGAVEEGTFRKHVISQGGRLRHSTWFSITDDEWPAVRTRLKARLARHRDHDPRDTLTASAPNVEIRVRPARPADAEAIARALVDSSVHHLALEPDRYRRVDPVAVAKQYRAPAAAPDAQTLVAEVRGTVVGVADLRIARPGGPHAPGEYAEVAELAVSESARGQGAGTALMAAAEAWGRAHGCRWAVLDYNAANKRAAVFYARLGYRPAGQIVVKDL
jgi:N-acetyltransferase